jgi:TonB family protein
MVAPAPAPIAMPEVVMVDLVSLPSPAAARAKAAKPQAELALKPLPKPAAPPPPPPAAKVLPKQAPRAEAKPRPKAKPRPPHEQPEELKYDDALASLRRELGEETPVTAALEEEADDGATQDQGTSTLDPVSARWLVKTERHVAKNWVDPPEFRNRGLQTELSVTLTSNGTIVGAPRITRSSGDPFADDNAVRALLRSSPLPAPPETGDWPFVFRPEDTF